MIRLILAMAKLDPTYQVAYGDSKAEREVVEYYSLSCSKCLELFTTDLPKLKAVYPEVRFVFHPDPADLLTLQAMVCLEKIDEEKRPLFLQAVLECLHENRGRGGLAILQTAMEALDTPLPDLDKLEFLETTDAYRAAYRFLVQEDVVTTVPSYEIDGELIDAAPTFTALVQRLGAP